MWRSRWIVAAAVIAAIIGMGLCLLDAGHAAAGALCLSLLATTGGLLFLITLASTRSSLFSLVEACPLSSPDPLAPPPRP